MNSKSCYFCTSTYQLFSIIMLHSSSMRPADLYIEPQFAYAEIIAQRIRNMMIFDHVILIDANRIYKKYFKNGGKLSKRIDILRSYINLDSVVGEFLVPDTPYDNMYVSSKAYFPRTAYLYFTKMKYGTKLNYIDDGVGSYYRDGVYAIKKLDRIFRYLIFGADSIKLKCERYLFSPELFNEINPTYNTPLHCIDSVNEAKHINVFNTIFDYKKEDSISENVIILGDVVRSIFDDANRKALYEIYDLIVDICGESNVILKKHPRDTEENYRISKVYKKYDVPFEVICMNSNIADKCLISVGSTSVSSPKILLGQEPYVIMLYKILHTNNGTDDALDNYFRVIQKKYPKGKFFVPENVEELKEALSSYQRRG